MTDLRAVVHACQRYVTAVQKEGTKQEPIMVSFEGYDADKLSQLGEIVGLSLAMPGLLPPSQLQLAGPPATTGTTLGLSEDFQLKHWCDDCPHGEDREGRKIPCYANPYYAGTMKPGFYCNEKKRKMKLALREKNGKAEMAAGRMNMSSEPQVAPTIWKTRVRSLAATATA